MRSQRPKIRFTPVQLKTRHDGWTAARQFRFIELLAATKSVTRACKAVGMSRESAYALRDRPAAGSFATAWKRALAPDFGLQRRRSRRISVRVRRFKVDEVTEVEGPPNPPGHRQSTSSAWPALETLLRRLKAEPAPLPSR